MYRLAFLATFLLLLTQIWGCADAQPKCAHGEPSPIFGANMPFVKNYFYEQKAQNASEQLQIPLLNLSLLILQSGCERVKQTFALTLNGTLADISTAPQTAELVADIFAAISELDKKKLANFFQIAKQVGNNAAQFSFDAPVLVQNADNSQLSLSLNLMREPSQTIISLTVEF